jgi:hypothetical protein
LRRAVCRLSSKMSSLICKWQIDTVAENIHMKRPGQEIRAFSLLRGYLPV